LLLVLDVGLPALKQSFRAFAGSLRCSSKPQLTLPSRPYYEKRHRLGGVLLSVLDVGLPALKQSFRAFAGSLRCSSKPQLTLPSRPYYEKRHRLGGVLLFGLRRWIAGPQAQLSGVRWLADVLLVGYNVWKK
jgi:hypothetical protein